tara:strand:- start:228 stop:2333 length:2106 start_codon:yes stop_codon:yes gene_type:complete
MAETLAEMAARRAAATEAATSPTQGEDTGGWRDTAGNIAENIISPLGPLLDKVEAGEMELGPITNFLIGGTKGAQFGGTGLMNALGETANNAISGRSTDQTFRERWQADADQVDENGSFAGEIAGGVATAVGGPIRAAAEGGKRLAARALPSISERLATRSLGGTLGRASAEATAAAGGGFTYSMLEGNEPSAASKDAILAFGFGGAGKLTAETLGALFRATGVVSAGETAATDLINKMRRTDRGAGMLTNEAGQYILDEQKVLDAMMSPDDTLLEMFPDEMLKEFTRVVNSGDDNVQTALRPFRSYLDSVAKAADPQFRQATAEALGSEQLRNPNQFAVATQAARDELQPLYDEAFSFENINPDMIADLSNPSGSVAKVDGHNIAEMARDFLDPLTNASSDAGEVLRRLTKRFERRTFAPQELLTLRNEIDSLVFRGSMNSFDGFDALSSIDKGLVRNGLVPFREAYNEMLYGVAPKLRELDAAYSNSRAVENAYEAGSTLSQGKNSQGNAYDVFMATSASRTPNEQAAFAEGLRNELFNQLDNASPQQAADLLANRGLRQNVTAVLGKEGLAQLETAVGRQLQAQELTDALAGRTPASGDGSSKFLQTILDAAIVTGAATKALGTGIGISAGRRGLANATPSTGISQNATQATSLAEMGMSQAELGSQLVNEALRSSRPVSIDNMALGALIPAAAGSNE